MGNNKMMLDPNPPVGHARTAWVWSSKSLRNLAICLLVYVIIAALVAPAPFVSFISHYVSAISFFMPILILPICLVGWFAMRRWHDPKVIGGHLFGRLPLIAILAFALLLVFTAYTTFKFKIPDIVPFYADAWAAGLDSSLHNGDPWRWTHAVWPEAWSNVIILFYNYLWFFYWFATPMFVILWLKPGMVKQYLWAMFLTFVICGTILAIVFSSVGPIFYADMLGSDRFADLSNQLDTLQGMDTVTVYAAYLFQSYEGKNAVFGTGISAIPSMHVAVVVLNAWLFSSLNRWAGLAAWGFAAMIMFGSVYTGWHYAVDGYLSFIAVSCTWVAVRKAHGHVFSFPAFQLPKLSPQDL